MTEEQKTRVIGYVTTLDSNITAGDLLDLVVDTVTDRVLLYLNETALDSQLERIVAQVVTTNYQAITARTNGIESSVSRVEDNGQAITFKENTVKRFAAGDESIFSGFDGLLKPYRRIHVIAPEL